MNVIPAYKRQYLGLQQRALKFVSRMAVSFGRVTPRAAHLLTGESGETAALFYLRNGGYIISARRYTSPKYKGDIDLIGWDGDTLCFIEVKTRSTRSETYTAESSIDRDKREALRRLAREYVRHVGRRPGALRFDVLTVYGDPTSSPEFHLYRNAFSGRPESRYFPR